jgi:type II secretory pathway component PulK
MAHMEEPDSKTPSVRNIVNQIGEIIASEKNSTPACSGMALAAVLIIMALAAAVVIHGQVASKLALRGAERNLENKRLRVAAANAAIGALSALRTDADFNVTHTNETWAAREFVVFSNGIETVAQVMDEQRLFDINNFSSTFADGSDRRVPDIMARLLDQCGAVDPAGTASGIRDWFVASGKNSGIVESPAAFVRIAGGKVNESCIGSFFTVLPVERSRALPVNVNTVSLEALAAITGDASAAEAIVAVRNKQPVMSLAELEKILGSDRLASSRAFLDVRSGFFSVRAVAARNGLRQEVFALARRDSQGSVDVLRWVFR